jgi:hypothetical protein
MAPGTSSKEYVQWQRGPKTSTSLNTMTSWVDTCLAYEKVWLVLTFHGVDGIGYEPKTGDEMREFFNYIKKNEKKIWVATFKDAVKYIRQRMYANLTQTIINDTIKSGNNPVGKESEAENCRDQIMVKNIIVQLNHSLDKELYNHQMTLKTYIPDKWAATTVKQGNTILETTQLNDKKGKYILYNAYPNSQIIKITGF